MEAVSRKSFQGIRNIIRFNWHFYLLAFLFIGLLLFLQQHLNPVLAGIALAIAFGLFFVVLISLMVSLYVYDLSDLYNLTWLDDLKMPPNAILINIHAGFDETSALLATKYPDATLTVLDFYDPKKHTEVSIRRARKVYPPNPQTIAVDTVNLPLIPNSIDVIFCLLSAHEIRNDKERTEFFLQLKQSLKDGGRIVLIEHLRDISNFVAYTIGFLHFYSRKIWEQHFKACGLLITKEFTITPFITGYILQKNGTAS
jgi:SAM-dependent methyltransferase